MNMGVPMGYNPNAMQGYGASSGWGQPMSMNGYVPNQAYYQPGSQQAYQNGYQTTVVTQQPRTYMPESPWYSVWRDNSGYNRYAWQPIGNGIDDGGMSASSFGGRPVQGAYPSVPSNASAQNQEYYYTPTNVNVRLNFNGLRNYLAQNPQAMSQLQTQPMMATGGGFDFSVLNKYMTQTTMGPGPMPPPTDYAPGTYPAPYTMTQTTTALAPTVAARRPVAMAMAV